LAQVAGVAFGPLAFGYLAFGYLAFEYLGFVRLGFGPWALGQLESEHWRLTQSTPSLAAPPLPVSQRHDEPYGVSSLCLKKSA
jgi:hypothetical protein